MTEVNNTMTNDSRYDETMENITTILEAAAPVKDDLTEEQLARAIEILARARQVRTQLDKLRSEIKKPAWAACKSIDGEAKPLRDSLLDLDAVLEEAIVELVGPPEEEGKQKPERIRMLGLLGSGASIGWSYLWEVEDIAKVPAKYLKIDKLRDVLQLKELNKLISEANQENRLPRKVPGLTISRKPIVITRARAAAA